MSRNQALTINELWDETQRLNEEIADLQARLARYENVEPASTRATDEHDADAWNVWPYCWALSVRRRIAEWFHSFHRRLEEVRLTRRNKQAREAFWQRPHPEEITLKLL